MSNSHYNAANVWGRVVETKRGNSQGGKPFQSLRVNCTGRCGAVQAYGRLWGDERINGFLAQWKKAPDGIVRFRGFFSQYLSSGVRLTNFSFYQWDPAPDQAPRAAFILRGDVVDVREDGEEGTLTLDVVRKGKNGYRDESEKFELWGYDPEVLMAFQVGETWEVKGYLQQGRGEDEFGAADGPVRPYILQAKKIR